MTTSEIARAAGASRNADRNAAASRDAEKDATRADSAALRKRPNANRGADPANSDQASALRAIIAARNNAAAPTAESMRQAMASAKKAASVSREQDYGAER